jgi:F-type H+-transporting ATPase subunit gamma
MAGAKEIRTKIKSVRSTQKITRAMEMVAASKMRNAQIRMNQARPYANKIRQVIAHVAQANPEYKHAYLLPREVKRVGFIVVSTDRGLCGGLNTNLFRAVANAAREYAAKDIGVRYCVFGNKALGFFKRFGGRVLAEANGMGDKPHLQQLIGPVKVMLDAYASGEIDRLVLASNHFVNTMTQKPQLETLLPVQAPDEKVSESSWDYLYEPDAPEVLDVLLDRYIESLVYQSVIENGACEQAARMVAMKAATENAGNLIHQLQLIYNKARQAAITQEIAEIVGGAAAV